MTAGPIAWRISAIVTFAPALERPLRPSRLLAGALIAALALADLAFALVNGRALTPGGHDYAPATLAACLAFGVPGALVLARAPRIGALMLLIGVSLGLAGALTGYVLADLPGSATAIWILNWSWVPGYSAIPLLVLLLPDGQVLWPRVAWACVAAGVLLTLGVAFAPYALEDFPVAFGEPVNPLTVGFAPALEVAGWVLLAPCALLAVWSIVRRLRSSEQLKWIALGGVLTVALLALAQVAGEDGDVVAAAAFIPLPASIAIAVLRHGLWDVDLVINRSLVYVTLTLAGVAGYVVVAARGPVVAGRPWPSRALARCPRTRPPSGSPGLAVPSAPRPSARRRRCPPAAARPGSRRRAARRPAPRSARRRAVPPPIARRLRPAPP